jgi:dTDP-4-amino-4,6-dideoxygalactose transaminase
MQMSEITQMLLRSVDFEFAAERRRGNWKTLHEKLKSTNRFEFSLKDAHVPLFYPYLSHGKELREYLIENKVYVAMYWPGIKEVVPEDSFEFDLVENMLPLPIDQRYDSEDMREITRLINEFES